MAVVLWLLSYVFAMLPLFCLSAMFVYKRRQKRTLFTEIIVFTRYPVPGKAKTRMIPTLGELGAAMLQICMTEHILANLKRFSIRYQWVGVTFQYNGGTPQQMDYWLQRKYHGLPADCRPQHQGDLGEKLKCAIKESFDRGNKHVIVIGADIPGINENILSEAVESLQQPGKTDMVLGRAADGGYYLVGFNKIAYKYLDSIFLNIDWGTDQVFLQQSSQARQLGIKMEVLRTVLHDVDDEEDLVVFEKEVGILRKQLTDPKWSIVIPVRNEAGNIQETIDHVQKHCSNISKIQEILVVDGGSTDDTIKEVEMIIPDCPVPVSIIQSSPGRGPQQIAGATAAKGDYLLFLHADTKLPKDFDRIAAHCLQTPGNVAGAFEFQFDILEDQRLQEKESKWFISQMKFLRHCVHIRCKKHELPYGDQALFMSKRVYEDVGGFPPYRLMEDYILVQKLQTIGHVGICEGSRAVTSYRRWKKWGLLRITGMNQIILWAYRFGVHPNTLARWYYGS